MSSIVTAFTSEELHIQHRSVDCKVGDITPIVKELKLSSAKTSTASGSEGRVQQKEVPATSDEDVAERTGRAHAFKSGVRITITRRLFH